jgi:hypothetical protein
MGEAPAGTVLKTRLPEFEFGYDAPVVNATV